MPQIKVLSQQTQTTGEMTDTTYGAAVALDGALTYGAQCVVDVDTPAAKTFNSGVAALLAVQDLTYTAVLRGTAGNSITIAYTAGGTAGAEVVTVVGSAISVQIETGVSTATQVRTAINASAAAIALISCAITGTGSTAQVTAAAAPLATGAASAVDTSTEYITIASHGLTTGLKGQLTTTGTLPTGLSTGTDYFVISINANTIQLASSLANAQAGTPINLTSQGSSGAVNTFTPTAIAGASVILQKSCDAPDVSPTNWSDEGSASNITVDANVYLEKINPTGNWMRLKFVITAGRMSSSNTIVVKGPN